MKPPGYHLVPSFKHYLLMKQADRDELLLWLKKYADGLFEIDKKAPGPR